MLNYECNLLGPTFVHTRKNHLMDSTSSIARTDPAQSSELYPPIEPYNHGWLRVSDLHEIYYEESGNEDGTPIVFL